MLISDLLSVERVLPNVRITSKKRLLELISDALVRNDPSLNPREVFESFCAREKLGSTDLGHGVAIPHGRVKGTTEPQAAFLRLVKPIGFDAIDGQAVDLLFALTVPENCTNDHLQLLAQVADRFGDAEFLAKLRKAGDANELMQLLTEVKS